MVAGPVIHCLAQMLLRKKKVTEVSPKDLAGWLSIHHTSAGYILSSLSWRRQRLRTGLSIYHYEGRDKVFSGAVVSHARKLLGKLLGMSREEVLEVLA